MPDLPLSELMDDARRPLVHTRGVLLEFEFPKGTGVWTPTRNDFNILGVGVNPTVFNEVVLNTDGYAEVNNTGFVVMCASAVNEGLPPKSTNCRLYELWGRYDVTLTTMPDFCGGLIEINRRTASDRWTAYMQDFSNSFDPYISQHIAGAWASRYEPTNINFSYAPALWKLSLFDMGDRLYIDVIMWQEDTTIAAYRTGGGYYSATRTDATVESFSFRSHSNQGDCKYGGFRITDI